MGKMECHLKQGKLYSVANYRIEGLQYNLMKAPAVSGAQTYPELCMAAKNEEKHQAELKKWQEYQRPTAASPAAHSFRKSSGLPSQQPLGKPNCPGMEERWLRTEVSSNHLSGWKEQCDCRCSVLQSTPPNPHRRHG